MRVLSSFLAKKLTYKGCFTSDVEKNTSEINFFLGFSVNFLGQVVTVIADKVRWKVKIHLFFRVAHLTLGVTTQVVARQCTPPCLKACGSAILGVWPR